ncbi:OmpA family protein [uncultured Psychromonas sp.]|uniref:OmpA family protein n=1 Tax=uncultured Psychromonas sp. TaxID=173974 RepID=UPI00260B375C|nr:OmpA family protein [uncultured Psychromonas sp.]
MELFLIISVVFVVLLNIPTTTKVTLLPDEKENSQITVFNESGTQVVNKSGDAVAVASQSTRPTTPKAVDLEKITLQHASLFAIQPQKSETFLLYFENNGADLLSESKLLIAKIIATANDRSSPIINIIGHSDAAGSSEYNLALSLKRATAVANLLQSENIKDVEYRIDSYGENDPLVKSGKEIEPKNRRVEVEIW